MDKSEADAIAAPSVTPASPVAIQNDTTKKDGANQKELMDHVLNFLSTSSNETLLGVFALLMLGTYIILGRVGLLLIGIAAGVILHASWEGVSHGGDENTSLKKRKELALEVSHRLLEWPKRSGPNTIDSKSESGLATSPEELSETDLEFTTFQPATAAALRTLTDTIIKDYVE